MSAVADTLDKDVFSTLTPEEQAAINDHEYTPAELAALKNIAGDTAADDGAADGDDDGGADEVLDANGNPVPAAAAPAGDKPADTPAAPAQAAAADTQAQDVTPAPKDQQAPVFVAKLPDDYQARVDALATKTTELRDKFKAGDIDLDTFDAENAALQSERDDLVVLRAKSEISQDMTQQSAQQAWATTVNTFFSSVKTSGGPDYMADEARRNDLDLFVKALANDDRNNEKPMDWFLTEAHKRVQALHGAPVPAPTPTPAPAKDPVAEARAKRTPNLETAPKTLAQVPGADGPGDVGSEFAHLDALEGDALESAIARLSPAQREKYARGD
jgi:hypothetical protein